MNELVHILKPITYKDDKNGFICIKTNRGEHITNYAGKFLIDLLYEQVPIEILIKEFQLEFGLCKKNAVIDVGEFLSSLKTMGFIEYDDKIFKSDYDTSKFKVAGEIDYELLSKTITHNLQTSEHTLFNAYDNKEYYNVFSLRARAFRHDDVYFYSNNINNEITTIIGLSNMMGHKSPVNIILLQSSVSEQEICELYEYVESELKRLKKHKVKFTFISSKSNNSILSFLNKYDFLKEGELVREDGVNNCLIFSKLL